MQVIKVGTRGSALALRQTQGIVEQIQELNPGIECSIEIIKTTGDRILDTPLSGIGDKGLFVKEIETALMAGEIDLAIHSAKDLPSEMDERLCVGAFPKRVCPADALISKIGTLETLPAGAIIGTSSLRRRAQILAARPDIIVKDLRGNLDTRLKKLDNGDYDAIILACAGLSRLGLDSRITQVLDYKICLPAVGQGALAVQCRVGDPAYEVIDKLDSSETRCCVTAERTLLTQLGGGCQVPIAALANIVDEELVLDALVAELHGKQIVRMQERGSASNPEQLGEKLGKRLLASPAKELLEAARTDPGPIDRGAA
ncbi:MAG: hydroxymethylbilane synthase [Armatimonadota bacterium]|jgi:hydroxymethylbilane synthase